jgi:ribose/xylose/arabinose/galactoside ABC-type transport system permease subunit
MSDARQPSRAPEDYGEGLLGAALARGEIGDDERTVGTHSRLRRLIAKRDIALALAGFLLFIVFSLTTETFLTEFNLTNMVRNVSLIGIVAVGMTFILIVGEIDLSVGSVLGFLIIVFGVLVTSGRSTMARRCAGDPFGIAWAAPG